MFKSKSNQGLQKTKRNIKEQLRIVPTNPVLLHNAPHKKIVIGAVIYKRVREVSSWINLSKSLWFATDLSHAMTKRVFGGFRPGQTQTGLCSHRS